MFLESIIFGDFVFSKGSFVVVICFGLGKRVWVGFFWFCYSIYVCEIDISILNSGDEGKRGVRRYFFVMGCVYVWFLIGKFERLVICCYVVGDVLSWRVVYSLLVERFYLLVEGFFFMVNLRW